jgi:hypothetical protein
MWNGSYWVQQGGGNDNIQGQNISLLNNDSGYITQEDIPSVLTIKNGKLCLEKYVADGENIVISEVTLPAAGDVTEVELSMQDVESAAQQLNWKTE